MTAEQAQQIILAYLDVMTGGRPIRAYNGDQSYTSRPKLSDAQFRTKLKAMLARGDSWADIYAELGHGNRRLHRIYRELLQRGEVSARPKGPKRRGE